MTPQQLKSLSISFILIAFVCFNTRTQAQSRDDIQGRSYDVPNSVPVTVLVDFYKDFPAVNNVTEAKYLSRADLYQVSFIDDGKVMDAYYTDDPAGGGEYVQTLTGSYVNWNELPMEATVNSNGINPQSIKEVYVLNVVNDPNYLGRVSRNGETHYYALKDDGDNKSLMEFSNGRWSSIYNSGDGSERQKKYHPTYRTSYNNTQKHLTDYLFAVK